MKNIFNRIIKIFRPANSGKSIQEQDLRRDAEKFARKMGPAIKQLSKE